MQDHSSSRLALIWCCALLCNGVFAVEQTVKIAFKDNFETPIKAMPGRDVTGNVRSVQGLTGKALSLSGASRVEYPAAEKVCLFGGEISFRIKLNFDPSKLSEMDKQKQDLLRNQMFVSIEGPPKSTSATVYTTFGTTNYLNIAVRNAEAQIVAVNNFPITWEPGKWHDISLRWGKTLELWSDGKLGCSNEWEGLFGTLPIDLSKLRIAIGAYPNSGIDNEFTIDDLVVKTPGSDQISNRTRTTVPLLSDEPVMDGNLAESFWQKAAKNTGFVGFQENELVQNQPIVYSAYTSKGIYFALEAQLPAGQMPQAMLTARDAALNSEDSIEIFLQPHPQTSTYYQFIGSAKGARFDAMHIDGQIKVNEFNPDWEIKTQGCAGKWTAEIFIPYKALQAEMPKSGQIWNANFCIDSAAGYSKASCWSFTAADFQQPAYFGQLFFAGESRSLRLEKLTGFSKGEPVASFKLEGDFKPVITLKSQVFDSGAKKIFDFAIPLRDSKSAEIRPGFLPTGFYTMKISAIDETGQTLLYDNFSFRPVRAFSLKVENYPYSEYLQIEADTQGMKQPASRITCKLLACDNNNIMDSIQLSTCKPGLSKGKFRTGNLHTGTYKVQADALSAAGKVLETGTQSFRILPKPNWWKTNAGLDHSVPVPFKPVESSKQGIKIWGREYLFLNTIFPKQITNQGTNIFGGEVAFNLKTKDKTIDISSIKEQQRQSFPDQVILTGKQDVGNISVDCKTTVEFDGMARFDITLLPSQATEIDELSLIIPVKNEQAALLLTSNGANSSIVSMDKDFSSRFLPCLWLGNDDMGLTWFAESDQYWTSNEKMIQILRAEKKTSLKINFIQKRINLQEPITFTFGLLPSPVKPTPTSDPFCHMGIFETIADAQKPFTFPESITYAQPMQVLSTVGTIEFWCKQIGPKTNSDIEIFHILGSEGNLDCVQSSGMLKLKTGSKTLISANAAFNSFEHVALSWDQQNAFLYINGNLAGTTDSKPLRDMLASKQSSIRFGCASEAGGFTSIILDDIRISKSARYAQKSFTLSQVQLQKDADTILIDNLDENFRPDGEDAETRGGGIATIGCEFVEGKFGQGLKMQVKAPRSGLEIMRDLRLGITTQFIYQDIKKYGWPPVLFADPAMMVQDLKKTNLKGKDFNIGAYPYVSFPAVTGPSPLDEQFGSEWHRIPIAAQPGIVSPEQDVPGRYYLGICAASKSFADYTTAGTAWLIDEYGFSGSYTDGLTHACACQNQAHGCGYIDENGDIHSTWPIFGTRELMKRMYRVVKARNPDGLTINHQSFNMLIPIISFSDIYFAGEHEDYEDMLNARLRFSPKPWGVYVTLLGSSEHTYSSLYTKVALLHGSCIWDMGLVGRKDSVRKEAAIREAYEKFGYKTAKWIPYFKAENSFYKPADEKIKASLYFHPGKDVLAIIGNYKKELAEPVTNFDLKLLGLEGKVLSARNALTGQELPISQNGSLTVQIKPKSFVVAEIESK